MKFISILLKEGRKEDLRNKYSDKIEPQILDWILGISDLVEFNHKYTDFVLKNMDRDVRDTESYVELLVGLVKDFNKYQSQMEKKDINQYRDIIELESALSKFRWKEKLKELESKVDRIFEDDKILVIKPKTHEASCKYGANTKWCTASTDSQHFERYTSGNQGLYYIINKANSTNKNYSKVAIHFDGMGYPKYWDSKDSPMTDREIEIFNYAFPEIIDSINSDYEKIAVSAQDKFLKEVFNSFASNSKLKSNFLGTESKLEVFVEGFETINDLGPGHAYGKLDIKLNGKLIDSYQIFITYKPTDKKAFETSIGFMGNDEPEGAEPFTDLELEGWGFDSKYIPQGGLPQNTAHSIRNLIAGRVMDYIENKPQLQRKVVGSAIVWQPNRSSYGYTFGKNKGLINKLINWLESGKIGTKLDFLVDIGKLDVTTKDGKKHYSHKGKGSFSPSALWRGHFSAFFASAKLAGILSYRKVGNQFFLTKGPNFEAFKKGELRAL